MSTLTVFADVADNNIASQDAVYSTARSGGTITLGTVNATFVTFGQTNTYICYEYFISFDTSSIGTSSSVTAAALTLFPFSTYSGSAFTFEARVDDWGTAVDTGDWVAGSALSGLTRTATYPTSSGVTAGTGCTFTEDGTNFQTNILKTGSTRLLICADKLTSGTAPTGTETVTIKTADNAGTTSDPKLVVTYTVAPNAPTALFPVAQQPSGVTDVVLIWQAPSSGDAPTGYKVERAPDSGGAAGTYVQINTSAITLYVDNDESLAYNTKYWYRVRGYNAGGDGAYCTEASVTTAAKGAPWLNQIKAPGFVTGTNPSITFDSALTVGSLVVICLRDLEPTSANIVDPTGFTRRSSQLAANLNSIIVSRVTQAGDSTTITFTDASSISYEIVAMEIMNCSTTNEFDQQNGVDHHASSETSVQPGTITPTRASEVFIVFVALPAGTPSGTSINSGFTNLFPVTSENRSICGIKFKTDATSENPTVAWSSAASADMTIMAAFNPLESPVRTVVVGSSNSAHRASRW